MKEPALKLIQLEIGHQQKGGRKIVLLPPINSELPQTGLVALAGINGAGKTTLLKTITGLHQPVCGSIEVFGMQLNRLSRTELAKMVSLVLTDIADDFYLRTEDVVAMGRYPHLGFWGKLKTEDKIIVEDAMNKCGIAHLKGRRLISLSDGERQKTFIAKALAQDTPLIVLDEPSAFLDYPGKLELMTLLRTLVSEQQKTILFSSHDLDLLMRFADQLWLISPSKPLVNGSPETLASSGIIGEYFNRNNLVFNSITGKFQSINLSVQSVFVDRNVANYYWVVNALNRNGFALNAYDSAMFHVVDKDGNYKLTIADKQYICADIDELIHQILKQC